MAVKMRILWVSCALVLSCLTSCGTLAVTGTSRDPGVRTSTVSPTASRRLRPHLVFAASGPSAKSGRASQGRQTTPFRPAGPVSYADWAAMFLRQLQAPTCAGNMIAVVAWIDQVRGRGGWNPIDATAWVPGSWLARSGVRGYPTLQAGLEGAVLSLWEGLSPKGYGPIVRDLQQCASAPITARAIQQSGWCPGCNGGTYVEGLIPSVTADFVAQYGPPPVPVSQLTQQQMDAVIYSIWGGGTVAAQAECIANHESGDDPSNVNPSSGAAGLFQLMPFWWNGNNQFGWKFDPFDPRLNAYYARLIWQRDGWPPWTTMHFCT